MGAPSRRFQPQISTKWRRNSFSDLVIFNALGLKYLEAQPWKISPSYTFDIYFLLVNKGTKEFWNEEVKYSFFARL